MRDFFTAGAPNAAIWPLSVVVAKELPAPVRKALYEAKVAHAVGADLASLLAARTALIRMQRDQKSSGIDDLMDKGVITKRLASQAHEVRLWANAVAHDDVAEDVPSASDVDQLLKYIDIVLDAVYVQPAKLTALQDKRSSNPAS